MCKIKTNTKEEKGEMHMNKNDVIGLIYYYEHTAEQDPGIQAQTLEVLNAYLEKIEEEEAAAAKKRKSPNKSGIVQVDAETGKVLAIYATQKEALIAIGKEGKSGIGDALNRAKTHKAYGYKWFYKDAYEAEFGPVKL